MLVHPLLASKENFRCGGLSLVKSRFRSGRGAYC